MTSAHFVISTYLSDSSCFLRNILIGLFLVFGRMSYARKYTKKCASLNAATTFHLHTEINIQAGHRNKPRQSFESTFYCNCTYSKDLEKIPKFPHKNIRIWKHVSCEHTGIGTKMLYFIWFMFYSASLSGRSHKVDVCFNMEVWVSVSGWFFSIFMRFHTCSDEWLSPHVTLCSIFIGMELIYWYFPEPMG